MKYFRIIYNIIKWVLILSVSVFILLEIASYLLQGFIYNYYSDLVSIGYGLEYKELGVKYSEYAVYFFPLFKIIIPVFIVLFIIDKVLKRRKKSLQDEKQIGTGDGSSSQE